MLVLRYQFLKYIFHAISDRSTAGSNRAIKEISLQKDKLVEIGRIDRVEVEKRESYQVEKKVLVYEVLAELELGARMVLFFF